MNKLLIFAKKYGRVIAAIFIILFLTAFMLLFLYRFLNPPISVIAEFTELGPLYKKMPVYYKGYKIGNTSTIKPSKDYKATLVTIVFYPDDLKLPANISAKDKKLSNGIDYINLEYPQEPSGKNLKTGDVIHGMTTLDIQSFMNAQVESGALGSVTENIGSTLATFAKAGEDASDLMKTLTATVNENRASIKASVNNLNIATENINNMVAKIDNSISVEKIEAATGNFEATFENIEQTSTNIKEITSDIQLATENLNQTMARIDSTLCQINGAATNINAITAGVRSTLSQNMAAFKILFGKPMKEPCCKRNCYNKQ